MQSAETVLRVLRERGRRGLPCNELYRQLFNPRLYLMAYGRIYANKGAMTPGADGETADGMTTVRIGRIIDALRHERYRFQPVKRVYIPKKNGKKRPLGLPTWSDKIVAEVMRLLLEAYYEPRFSDQSHGFRPGRGCHTALRSVGNSWTGTTWFIEGDISDCFGSLDHEVMISTLSRKIHDNRFLRLLRNMLTAGYLEDWDWHATLSGAPQGGVLSPLLSNIYLDRLDRFVETVLIPEYTRGKRRKFNPAYREVFNAIRRAGKRGDQPAVRRLRKQLRALPSQDPNDPGYRRLHYVRYADDTLLGFIGPKAEAEKIKQRLATFLRDDLALELNKEKTLITHARTGAAKFLGYEIVTHDTGDRITNRRRSTNGKIGLRVPRAAIKAKYTPYTKRGQPAARTVLMAEDDYTIINTYGAEYRGFVQYYLLAYDVYRIDRLHWVMWTSLLKTLARKYDSSVMKMVRRYKAAIDTPYGPRRCLQVSIDRGESRNPLVARFGGIPLRRQWKADINDRRPAQAPAFRQELITRLKSDKCEMCERTGPVEVHQIRKLADLPKPGKPQPPWAALMAAKRRKTLVVCVNCHSTIHS
jgi:group II intron reverse transcriptase/maturase